MRHVRVIGGGNSQYPSGDLVPRHWIDRKDEIVFAQEVAAVTVFYAQKGWLKVVVISEQGKKAGRTEP
jgi:hypothetical protein